MNHEVINPLAECERLSDADLIREVKFLGERARHNEIRLLAHLAEFDSRRLCLEEGHRSLYEYCTHALGFDEQEAYRRIRAARIIRAFPEAFAALAARKVTISSLVVLSPWLQKNNAAEWIKAAEGKSKRELEAMVAAKYPQAPQPDFVRNLGTKNEIVHSAPPQALEVGPPKVPESASPGAVTMFDLPAAGAPIDGGPSELFPVSIGRVRVGFDAAAALADLIQRMRQLLRHKYPEGKLEDLVREALEHYLDRKDPERKLAYKRALAHSGAPRPEEGDRIPTRFLRAWTNGRYIPAKVKSEVWARDEGRCAWRDKDGIPCGSKDWIEYDHIRPYARGGRSDDPRNLRLVCRQHNQAAALAAGFSVGGPPS